MDRAKSGASVADREGLEKLIKAAKSKDFPFDCLLVDEISRIARNRSDALRAWKAMEFHGVTMVSVAQGIESSQVKALPPFAMYDMADEQCLVDISERTHWVKRVGHWRGLQRMAASSTTTIFRLKIRSVRLGDCN